MQDKSSVDSSALAGEHELPAGVAVGCAQGAVQRGVSFQADFSQRLWTFEMEPGYRVSAGQFFIVTDTHFAALSEENKRLKDALTGLLTAIDAYWGASKYPAYFDPETRAARSALSSTRAISARAAISTASK